MDKPIIWINTPGNSFTAGFLDSYDKLKNYFTDQKIPHVLNTFYSADIYACRNALVALNNPIPWDMMVPFGGKPYDFMMWIDSDIQFEVDDILNLIKRDVDIVSAVCPKGYTPEAPFGDFAEEEEYGQPCIRYVNLANIDKIPRNMKGLIEVDFVGFAFMLIRKGVFEKMDYPYFRTTIHKFKWRQFNTSEDTGWCIRAKEAGFKVYVDPHVRVKHTRLITYMA
jgi:hypothetical protein